MAMMSCVVTAFVFVYTKSRFSHDAAHMLPGR